MSLYAPSMAAVMMPRNKPSTLSTTEAHSRRCRWMTSQQLLTPWPSDQSRPQLDTLVIRNLLDKIRPFEKGSRSALRASRHKDQEDITAAIQ
ncbi:hypothetical protein EYF80_022532 [Liparis tanakae]|uniref:Uncharacterized protein n=1 Tax=Liparis tanakae TaxID=230148 RepID=A0A4Z2HQJ2_9TELE|nr:hypothetical protein EYF80_022532 [Liparis tanakae]